MMSVQPAEVGSWTTSDGVELHTTTWKPSGQVKAVLIHLHGFSDHAGRTADFFPTLAGAGIETHVLDQRGWGRSVKKPADVGNTGGTAVVMADITAWVKSKLPSSVPVFLSGHSMGGGEVLYYAAHGPREVLEQLSGIISIAPWITLDSATQPWRITILLGKIFSRILPQFKLVQKLDPSFLSHDDAANQTWVNDPLCHNTATLQTFDGCLSRADELRKGEAQPQATVKRIWLGHGEDDRITSPQGSQDYKNRVSHPNLTFKLYPGARHCLHVEPDTKEEFFNDLITFILAGTEADEPRSKL